MEANAVQVKEFDERDWDFQTTVDEMGEEVKESKGEGGEKDGMKKKRGFLRKVLGAMQKKK
jgi:hypothetical protein